MKYTIQAIPTEYNGRRFRSRLEARWAVMFDLLGWRYEYEPCDLGSWSPDFLITGSSKRPVFAEVKPLSPDDPGIETIERIAHSANNIGFDGDILLLGISPYVTITDELVLGWIDDGAHGSYGDHWSAMFCAPSTDDPKYDFCHPRNNFGRISGKICEEDGSRIKPDHDQIMRLWAKAGNKVQWRGREGRS